MRKPQTTLNIVTTLMQLITIVIVISLFMWLQWQLLSVFNTVNDSISVEKSSLPFGMSLNYNLSENILGELYRIQSDRTQAGWSTLLALNLHYFYALGMTLLLAFLSAILLSVMAYLIAMGIDELEVRGWWGASTSMYHLFDTLPYILWTIVFLSLGLAIFSHNPAGSVQYFIFLLCLYVGFGMFLLPFFIQENVRKFRGARHDGVFDGESMSGLSDWQIRLRLLHYRFSGAFKRQILYGAIFMMLFDFSLYSIVSTHQPGHTATVFVQGNIYYQKHYREAEIELKLAQSFSYQELLNAFAAQVPTEHEAQPLAKRLVNRTWEMLDISNRENLQAQLENDEHTFLITITKEDSVESFDQDRLLEQLRLSQKEQEVIFFKHLSNYYIYMNVLVLFGLFMLFFIIFDLRKLFQNA